jgi:hypothetical protein
MKRIIKFVRDDSYDLYWFDDKTNEREFIKTVTKMEKYYTPEIEEFHVGFEFEYNKGGNNWVKHTSGNHDFRDGIIDVGVGETDDALYNPFYMGISERDFRVKYLDREDIESLGFTKSEKYLDPPSAYHICKDWKIPFNGGYITPKRVMIWYQEKTKHLKVVCEDSWEQYRLFQGTIKNKSELKKLLKQLGI